MVLLPSGLKEGLSPQRFISVVRPDQTLRERETTTIDLKLAEGL